MSPPALDRTGGSRMTPKEPWQIFMPSFLLCDPRPAVLRWVPATNTQLGINCQHSPIFHSLARQRIPGRKNRRITASMPAYVYVPSLSPRASFRSPPVSAAPRVGWASFATPSPSSTQQLLRPGSGSKPQSRKRYASRGRVAGWQTPKSPRRDGETDQSRKHFRQPSSTVCVIGDSFRRKPPSV